MKFLLKCYRNIVQRIQLEIAYRKSLKNAKEKDPFIY